MLPQLFLDRMKQMLEEEYPAFLNSYEDARYQALRINPSKTDMDRLTEETSFHLQPVPWEANGVYYEKESSSSRVSSTVTDARVASFSTLLTFISNILLCAAPVGAH